MESFRPFYCPDAKEPEDMWVGEVRYVDLLKVRLRPNDKERFFYKHRAFESEQEFRMIISLATAEEFGVRVPQDGIFVDILLSGLLDEILIGPNVTDTEIKALDKGLRASQLSVSVVKSSLVGRPLYV